MPYFLCRLATDDGRLLTESYLAASREECRKHFEGVGFHVLAVKRDLRPAKLSVRTLDRKIKDRDFILFNQDLMALLKAGYPVLRSVEIIAARVKNILLKEILIKVQADIRSGKTISEAFLPYEDRFSTVYTASLMAGEQSGNLAGSLGRYLVYARSIAQTKSRIKSALIYPSVLLVFSFVLLLVLLNFILPRFAGFYAEVKAELPGISRALMTLALRVRQSMVVVVPLLVLAGVVFFLVRKKDAVRVWVDRVKLKIPLARAVWLESGVSLFCRTCSLLLGAGITLLASLNIAAKAIPNRYLRNRLAGVPGDIKNGQNLTDSLARAGFFPALAIDMIRIGETSANLEGMMSDVADTYDERVKARVDTFVSLIEPVIIIFMGLLIALMLLSVYLPIFNIIKVAR
ncbi:MAG: type II secretion system F family protein [Candidatus Aminicenantes bacterium]|nr:type II secretion system F family protein [Candidatus Aminicenantes bacterium]